jgi:hypothetical protein
MTEFDNDWIIFVKIGLGRACFSRLDPAPSKSGPYKKKSKTG